MSSSSYANKNISDLITLDTSGLVSIQYPEAGWSNTGSWSNVWESHDEQVIELTEFLYQKAEDSIASCEMSLQKLKEDYTNKISSCPANVPYSCISATNAIQSLKTYDKSDYDAYFIISSLLQKSAKNYRSENYVIKVFTEDFPECRLKMKGREGYAQCKKTLKKYFKNVINKKVYTARYISDIDFEIEKRALEMFSNRRGCHLAAAMILPRHNDNVTLKNVVTTRLCGKIDRLTKCLSKLEYNDRVNQLKRNKASQDGIQFETKNVDDEYFIKETFRSKIAR